MSSEFISSIWDFRNVEQDISDLKVHNFLRWYGKLPPQLVRRLLNLYSKENDLVLANFSGSGTVALECLLNTRNCIGIDSNPLAVILTNVKAHPIEFKFEKFKKKWDEYLKTKPEKITTKDEYKKKWFRKESFENIQLIKRFINTYKSKSERDLLLLVLASTIKKLSLVDARCINHIVVDKNKKTPDALLVFEEKLEEISKVLKVIKNKTKKSTEIEVFHGDARKLPLKNNSVNLIISHPPYLGNVDYTNINQLENYILGYDYKTIRNTDLSTNNLNKYLENMYVVMDEMNRVVKKSGRICLIVGDNRKDGEIIPAFTYFIQYAQNKLGLKLEDIFIWVLSQKAGMNIKRHGNHIDHNYVLIFQKIS